MPLYPTTFDRQTAGHVPCAGTFDQAGHVPIVSSVTGSVRLVSSVFIMLGESGVSVVKLVQGDRRGAKRHAREIRDNGLRNFGRGLVEVVPILGNIATGVWDSEQNRRAAAAATSASRAPRQRAAVAPAPAPAVSAPGPVDEATVRRLVQQELSHTPGVAELVRAHQLATSFAPKQAEFFHHLCSRLSQYHVGSAAVASRIAQPAAGKEALAATATEVATEAASGIPIAGGAISASGRIAGFMLRKHEEERTKGTADRVTSGFNFLLHGPELGVAAGEITQIFFPQIDQLATAAQENRFRASVREQLEDDFRGMGECFFNSASYSPAQRLAEHAAYWMIKAFAEQRIDVDWSRASQLVAVIEARSPKTEGWLGDELYTKRGVKWHAACVFTCCGVTWNGARYSGTDCDPGQYGYANAQSVGMVHARALQKEGESS